MNSATSTTPTTTSSITTAINDANNVLIGQYYQANNQLQGNKRMIEFNENQRKRQTEYNKLLIFILFAVILFVGLNLVKVYFIFIPTQIIDLIIIILLTVVIIHVLYKFYFIFKRDTNNFDELAPVSNVPSTSNALDANLLRIDPTNGGTTGGSCQNGACCPDGTLWEVPSNMCVPVFQPFAAGNIYIGSQTVSSLGSNLTPNKTVLNGVSIYDINKTACIANNGLQICGNACVSSGQTCF